MRPWYADLEAIRSRGELAARPGSLAGLHARRKEHAGQFFTPAPLVRFLWGLVEKVEDAWRTRVGPDEKFALLDNACGVGAMFWPADPARHLLYGVDIDGDAIAALSAAAMEAGFEGAFINAGMEEITSATAHVAIINPPFGLHLNSPFITPAVGITTHGAHGPDTSALSQAYAIHQALESCQLVIAVIPETYAQTLLDTPGLAQACQAIISLPRGLFRNQGTDVRVSVAVLADGHHGGCQQIRVEDLGQGVPGFEPKVYRYARRPKAPAVGRVQADEPTITTPLTGDRRVLLSHSGRKLHLRFFDGLTEAKVRNAILRERVAHDPDAPRLASGVRYTGQGWLDLENLLCGANAHDNLQTLIEAIRTAGGDPQPSDSLLNYYRKRLRRDAVRRCPLRRWAYTGSAPDLTAIAQGASFEAVAMRDHLADPLDWCSVVIRQDERVTVDVVASNDGRAYAITRAGTVLATHTMESFERHFTADLPAGKGWRLVHEGRRIAFPELAAARTREMEAAGLRTHLHWDAASGEDCYQFDDVVELGMAPRGVLGWEPGTGKSRGAVALCLTGGRHNLIACEAHLVPEIVEEIEKMGLDPALWQVLEHPRQLDELRKINLISYSRLRSPLHIKRGVAGAGTKARRTTSGRRTWARQLRRRLHTVVGDEAHILANRYSEQSRALWMLSPKRRYGMTGTAIPNYCRNALPLLMWAGADGTNFQPYGDYQPYICPENLSTMQVSRRGMDVFRDRHVSLEWAVREFEEDLTHGAKREVPRLRNVEAFRDLVAPHILRRVHGEPELARWVQVPEPTRIVHSIEWDTDHLRRYLITAWEFAAWYRDRLAKDGGKGKNLNLISLLAHVNEVCKASNMPHQLKGPAGAYAPLTSKQRAAADLLAKFAQEGRKSLLFATNPSSMRRIARLLEERGVDSVMYTGDISVAKRTRLLNKGFKNGSVPVAFISFGAGETGLNLPQASRVLFYNRFWTPKAEEQAGRRAIRPQQKSDVEYHYLHLQGGIDEYQAMMVSHKMDAIGAGLDYGEQEIAEGDFLHMTTILGRFCDDLAERWGVEHHQDLLEALKHAA